MDILPSDWDALQAVAGRVGFPSEQIGSLRRRLENPPPRPGRPYILLIGRPEAGLSLLLTRWLEADSDLLREIGERPVVLGRKPEEVGPKLGSWVARKWTKLAEGHLIVLQAPGRPSAAVLAQFASLGYLDQVLLVTRLGQPLSLKEREMAQALAPLTATVRVLVVALPGEDLTEPEAAEMSAYALGQMRQAGFGGRFQGAAIWYADGKARPGTITDPGKLLAINPTEVSRGLSQMTGHAMANLLSDLRSQAEKVPTVQPATVPYEEQERLMRELEDYLSDLGKELERQKSGRVTDTETLHRYVRDALGGWGAHMGVEGHWMRYVDRLRPGMQDAFFNESESALTLLEYEPGNAPFLAVPRPSSLPRAGLMRMAKRACIGFVFGLAAYLAVTRLLSGEPIGKAGAVLLSNAAVLVGAFLGYVVAGLVFRAPRVGPSIASEPPRPAALHGWQSFARRLIAWFGDQIRSRPSSPLEEVSALSERLLSQEIH